MWQRIVSWFQKPILIPTTDRNVVFITMFVRKGIVTLSYKGETKQALITDNTLRNMLHGKNYDKNSLKVFQTVAMLLLPLTRK